jgi:uncharacterized membrane protein
MGTSRLEAFSDGVIAIIVTIMVLQLTTPAQPTPGALLKLSPILLSYALSFLVVAIMWVNHHHLIHAVRHVSARLLWSNINLLFWMSLIPFVTDYLGRFHQERFPVALYGLDLGMCGLAFTVLRMELVRQHQHDRVSLPHANEERDVHRNISVRSRAGICLDLSFLCDLCGDPPDVFPS